MSITPSFKLLLSEKFGTRVLFDCPLKPYMAYEIGGPSDVLIFPSTEEELEWLAGEAKRTNTPLQIVGTGTNLLVHDEGIRGITLMLKNGMDSIEVVQSDAESVLVRCGGGVLKEKLLSWACQEGYSGLEFSSGVPGTIGGGIFMNAGTKYGSYGDILTDLKVFQFDSGITHLKIADLHFGYRTQDAFRNAVVICATFRLKRGNSEMISQEISRIISERKEKQPLDYPSCGSTFKNPPGYSAGRLIEKSGIKGLRIGGAEISERHANFILNKENATAADVMALIELIQRIVRERFEIELEPEVILIGGSSYEK